MAFNRYLTSLLLGGAMTMNSAVAEAGGMSRIGIPGYNSGVPSANRDCAPGLQTGHFPATTINNNIRVHKPATVNRDIEIYKPVSINKNFILQTNVDNSRNVN